jgi:nucleoside-diphosphate-sugar epimerase
MSYTQLDVPDGPITEDPEMVLLHDKVALMPAEQSAPKVVACVTGATSFVGSHLVRRLLRLGHTVHAPVRDMDESFIGFLMAMPGAAERLKLFKVTSLVDPGAYDEAMKGCEVLHHVASPFFLVGSKDQIQTKLLDPAIKGTENLLATCSKTPTIKKVILTGTCLTCCADFRPSITNPEFSFSEADWDSSCSEVLWPYVHSKVMQEKRAIEIADAQSQYELTIMAIGGTFGPMCSTHGTGISAMILKYIRLGLFFPAVPPMALPMNDVRDIAAMHSLAMSNPKAKGRYLPPQTIVSFMELCDGLKTDPRTWRALLPFCHFPDFFKSVFICLTPLLGFDPAMPDRLWGARGKVDTRKVEVDLDLAAQGFKALPISTSIVDMDLTWQKYGLSYLTSSLGRAMNR